jgi:hypothetical protein
MPSARSVGSHEEDIKLASDPVSTKILACSDGLASRGFPINAAMMHRFFVTSWRKMAPFSFPGD